MTPLLALALLAAPALVADAAAARDGAEAALAAFRAERIEAQAALIAEVQAAQAALSRARERAAAATVAIGAAEREVEAGAAAAAERAREVDALRRLLAESDGVDTRLAALADATRITVAPQPLHDRAGRPRTAPVVSLGGARRLAAGADRDPLGLVTEAGGALRVAGPPLDEARAAAVRRLAAGEASTAPIDLAGELGEAGAAEAWTVWRWLRAGGPFVWPILALALAALLVVIERAVATARARPRPGLADAVFAAIERGAPADARRHLEGHATPLARVLAAGLAAIDAPPAAREAALEAALAAEDLRLDRGLRLLAVFAGVAPLLGLLGTVSGMIGTFDVIAVHGTGEPRLLSGGIAQALTTTQLGLMVAVPTLLAHAVLARLAERHRQALEAAAARIAGAGAET